MSGVAGFSDDPAPLYLKPGDVVEVEIEIVGTLRNPIIAWSERYGAMAACAAQA
jgi:2-keto-4-pentenoate hydratase/2-oxohepta-3-ene-1,7-dioic acid hydratase in catechol pathway